MTSDPSSPAHAREGIPLRHQIPIYAAGIFSNGTLHLFAVIMPLWVLTIDPSPLTMGIVLGARQVLPVVLSIHGGALMDRIGIRKVMIGFAIIGAIIPFLFPILPFIVAIVFLQMLSGISATMGWIGTQAQIGAIMKGHPVYAGRVTFFNRFANLIGPPATGAAWDFGGAWGGFLFLGFWGVALLVACLALPQPKAGELGAGDGTMEGPVTVRDVLPRFSDYAAAFRLLAIPAIAFVIGVTLCRHATNGIQTSFYVVWLESLGMSGTLIGILISSSAILGGVGSLTAGWFARLFTSYRMLVISVVLSIILVAITPILGSFVLLLIASMLRGGMMGVSQPLLISLMAQSAGRDQGKGVGLRTTANRVSILLIPVIMGALAEFVGLAATFYLVGAFLIVAIVGVAVAAHKDFEPTAPKEGAP
jgi:MFS family permease